MCTASCRTGMLAGAQHERCEGVQVCGRSVGGGGGSPPVWPRSAGAGAAHSAPAASASARHSGPAHAASHGGTLAVPVPGWPGPPPSPPSAQSLRDTQRRTVGTCPAPWGCTSPKLDCSCLRTAVGCGIDVICWSNPLDTRRMLLSCDLTFFLFSFFFLSFFHPPFSPFLYYDVLMILYPCIPLHTLTSLNKHYMSIQLQCLLLLYSVCY